MGSGGYTGEWEDETQLVMVVVVVGVGRVKKGRR